MSLDRIIEKSQRLSEKAAALLQDSRELMDVAKEGAQQAAVLQGGASSEFMMGLTVFILACFVGYYVVWRVTPALHSPLMSITNAISSVIIVGALLAAGLPDFGVASSMGFLGVLLAAINIFGGFVVTSRMLSMFMSKTKK